MADPRHAYSRPAVGATRSDSPPISPKRSCSRSLRPCRRCQQLGHDSSSSAARLSSMALGVVSCVPRLQEVARFIGDPFATGASVKPGMTTLVERREHSESSEQECAYSEREDQAEHEDVHRTPFVLMVHRHALARIRPAAEVGQGIPRRPASLRPPAFEPRALRQRRGGAPAIPSICRSPRRCPVPLPTKTPRRYTAACGGRVRLL